MCQLGKHYTLSIKLLTVCIILISVIGCRKKEKSLGPASPIIQDNESGTAFEHAALVSFNNDLTIIGAQIFEEGILNLYKSGSDQHFSFAPCATVFISSPQVTVDFGTVSCTCPDGRTRSGKLIYDFSVSTNSATSFRMPGFAFNISAVNYVINNISVSVTHKFVKNTTPISVSGQTIYTGVNLTWKDSSSCLFEWTDATQKKITLQGWETMELMNSNDTNCYKGQVKAMKFNVAKLHIANKSVGSATRPGFVYGPESENYTANCSGLERDFSCAAPGSGHNRYPFIAGTLVLQSGTRTLRAIDFGNGTCDVSADITIGSFFYGNNIIP